MLQAPPPPSSLPPLPSPSLAGFGSQRVFQRAECTDYWRAARGIVVIFHEKFSK